jgi:hypothetical protein
VFPIAISNELLTIPVVERFAAKAPTAMAGKALFPLRRTRATARPVGGQMGEALGLTEAKARLAFAIVKYNAAASMNSLI